MNLPLSPELHWLLMSLALSALMPFPYVLERIRVRGLMGALGNPKPDDPPLSDWAERARRAHGNAVENLVVFAPAALAVHLLSAGTALTAGAAAFYFWSRLLHYAVYTAGVPVVRTLAFFVGWGCTALLLWRAMGLGS